MATRTADTSYARLSTSQARAVLAALLLAACFCVGVTLSPLARGNADKQRHGQGDVALYLAEAERIHAGEGYYQAAAAELRQRGYPTLSVFNWRTPLPMWLIGRMPAIVLGKVLLGLLSLGLIVMAFGAICRDGAIEITQKNDVVEVRPAAQANQTGAGEVGDHCALRHHAGGRPWLCTVLLAGPLMFCVLDDLFVMPVLWSGVLIALSICAYGLNRPRAAVALGLASVLFRELALPYCLLAAAIAAWNGRRRELLAWTVGLAAWLVFFALHWWRVTELIAPGAHAHRESWIQCGGAAFVLSLAQMNAYLLLLPQWVAALYFVAAMFGLAGWHTPLGLRTGLTVCLFVTLFAVVGQEFNQYWGSLVAPLLCFGLARFPISLRELANAAALPTRAGCGGPVLTLGK